MSIDEAVEEQARRRRNDQDDNEGENGEDEDVEERSLSGGASGSSITERKGRATPGKRSKQDQERSNFIVRTFRSIRNYLVGVGDELDKVVWPTRPELIHLARIVVMVVLAAAAVLGVVSFLYNELFILGVREGHPEIFVVVFGLVAAGIFLYVRRSRSDTAPY